MPAAAILFTDVVGFSKLDTAAQMWLIEDLSREVQHEIRDLLFPARRDPEAIVLPTGDGMAVAFLREGRPLWTFDRVLQLAVRLLRWGGACKRPGAPLGRQLIVKLRVGIHEGSVEYVTDINGRTNICGDRINFAQRVMDAANENQILLSDQAVDEFLGGNPVSRPIEGDWRIEFDGPHDVLAKHNRRVTVYSAVVRDLEGNLLSAGMDKPPASKNLVTVSLIRDAEGIAPEFQESLKKAKQIALIQLTGERLITVLEKKDFALSEELLEFRVYMPEASSLDGYQPVVPVNVAGKLQPVIERWKACLQKLRERNPKARIKLGLFKYPPFFGASFLNWEHKPGSIHISPFVWGVAATKHTAYEIHWPRPPVPQAVEPYLLGLKTLDEGTEDALAG